MCALLRAIAVRASLSRGSKRFGHDFHAGKLFHPSTPKFAENVVQQRTVAATDFLELDAHAEIVGKFYLRFERQVDVKQVQHEPEVGSGAQGFRGVDARAEFRNLFDFAVDMLHTIDHLRVPFGIETRTASPVWLRTFESFRLRAFVGAVENDRLVLLLHLAELVVPRRAAFDALYGELTSQRRFRISGPDDLAHSLVAPALDHHKVADVHAA